MVHAIGDLDFIRIEICLRIGILVAVIVIEVNYLIIHSKRLVPAELNYPVDGRAVFHIQSIKEICALEIFSTNSENSPSSVLLPIWQTQMFCAPSTRISVSDANGFG